MSITQKYFQDILKVFKTGINKKTVRLSQYHLNIGDYSINLSFAGEDLIPLIMPAFLHLIGKDPGIYHLDVYLFDIKSTKNQLPQTPWKVPTKTVPGEKWISKNSSIKLIHQPDQNKLMMINLETNQAIYCVNDANKIPYYESSAPLRQILHWWMVNNGGQLLHAASVGIPNKGVILVGEGGTGKSVTALTCLNSDVFYTSDDYCLLTKEPELTIRSLYATGKTNLHDVSRFKYLETSWSNKETAEKQNEKALYFLHDHFKEKILNNFPLCAIIVVKVTNSGKPRLLPCSEALAFKSLAPSTLKQVDDFRVESHRNLSSLIKSRPCYILELGEDLRRVPDVIYDFLIHSPK